jgi:hypothetical protein
MIYISLALVFISILAYDLARKMLKIKYLKNETEFISRIEELEVRVTSLEFKKFNEKSKI